ncbi:hypothetical protein, partial [Mesorhizobium sp. M7A.F.Ca.CA.001.04.1.1]|uniref:hypothetical protein n=1 Tax=Mesorhizobium sp. M7A.F.Ca.CA.001.04.1.1 TaxID=2496714 RepID=UPI0019CFBF47
ASTATSNAPSGGQNKRRLKHLPTDLIAYLDGYLDEIAVGHFVLGDILQNTNCFRSGLFPGFEQLPVIVGYRAVTVLKIKVVPFHFSCRAGTSGVSMIPLHGGSCPLAVLVTTWSFNAPQGEAPI